MIRFACKQCGQRHQRPDEAAGSLIFCECGQANRVPWESTGAWPEEAEEAEEAPQPSRGPSDEDKNDRLPQRSRSAAARRRPQRPRHPGRCLDHQDCEAQHRCSACGEEFCSRCVVSFQGHMLCGPCKDHDMRRRQRPAPVLPLALVAFILGLISTPLVSCLTISPMDNSSFLEGRLLWVGIWTILPIVSLVLSLIAVHQLEKQPERTGRSLALTGVACALIGLFWSVSQALVILSHMVQG